MVYWSDHWNLFTCIDIDVFNQSMGLILRQATAYTSQDAKIYIFLNISYSCSFTKRATWIKIRISAFEVINHRGFLTSENAMLMTWSHASILSSGPCKGNLYYMRAISDTSVNTMLC